MTPEQQALPLIERIYGAALDPAVWQAFVDGLSAAYDDAAVGFVLQMPRFPHPQGAMYSTGFGDPAYRAEFARHATKGLPWEEARRANFVGRFGLASEVFPDAKVVDTEFYREWMKPQGLAAVGPMGHTIALEDGVPVASLAIFRRESGGPFKAKDLVVANLLVPHLTQAYRIHSEVRESGALAETLDRLPTGVILLDSRGLPVTMNRGARFIIDLDDGFSIDASGPVAMKPTEDALLKKLIHEATDASATGQIPEGGVMAISRISGRRAFPLMIAPLLTAADETALSDATTVLYVSDLEARSLPPGEALRSLYALTHAEIELVQLLCDGYSVEEAAHQRGVTMNTARSQLKQIFSKTGTSRQSELVRLVFAGVAPIRYP